MDDFETWYLELSKASQTLVIERMLQMAIIRYVDWYLSNRSKSVTDDYRVQLELVIMTCLRDLVSVSTFRKLGSEEARHTCLEKSYFSRLGRGKRVKLDEGYTIFLGWSHAMAEKNATSSTILPKLREVHANSNLLELLRPYVGCADSLVAEELGCLSLNNELSAAWRNLQENRLQTPEFEFFFQFLESEMGLRHLDSDLQHSVASIVDSDWEAGPLRVADRIEKIKEQFQSDGFSEPRKTAFEPEHVGSLFDNRVVVSASVASLSSVITQQFSVFISETGLNQTPELFKPLDGLPRVLNRIVSILEKQPRNENTEQALREEVGRLTARVAALEAELAKAKDEIADINEKSWMKVAGWTVASSGLFGVLLSAVWTVSGDELGPQKRLDRIMEYRDFIFSGDGVGEPSDHSLLPNRESSDGWESASEV